MSEPTSPLPAHPSLEQLRKQAKELLRAHRGGVSDAHRRFAAVIPRFETSKEAAALADAQFVIARESGFANWAALARHVRSLDTSTALAPLIRPIELAPGHSIALAGGDAASSDDVYAMFVATRAGDAATVRRLVRRHPALATYEYNYTPPIHFAVREGYADLVKLFFDHGANPAYRTYPFGDSLLTMAEDREHEETAAIVRARLAARFGRAANVATLLDAAKEGDRARLEAELTRDPRLAAQSNETGDTALHRAARQGHDEIARILLDAGADVDAVRSDGARPVHCASMPDWRADVPPERARALADLLLARGARYSMFLAAQRGDDAYVREVLARDRALANEEDTCHRRPLSAAAARGDLALVKLLLAHGADPRLPEAGAAGGTALWEAVYRKHYEIARLLVEHGADPNAMVESSGTPMFHARKDPVLLELLLAHGGKQQTDDAAQLHQFIDDHDVAGAERMLERRPELALNEHEYWSEGILCGPASSGDRPMLELLMRYGARVPRVTKWGPNYYFKHYETAKFLLEHGMDPDHMSWHRLTLLHHFAATGDLAKVRLLLDHGATLDAVDEEYRSTPLGMAARWGQTEVAALLLERGADSELSGAAWSTPLAWARKKQHTAIERVLLDSRLAQME